MGKRKIELYSKQKWKMTDCHKIFLHPDWARTIQNYLEQYPIENRHIRKHLMASAVQSCENLFLSVDKDSNDRRQVPPPVNLTEAMEDFRTSLPAFESRKKVKRSIKKNTVTLVTGGTGCGKTTQVPQYILEDASKKKKPIKVICTQPRRLPAIAIAKRVASERGELVGGIVGYHVRLEQMTSHRTVLTYCTSGVLLRMLTMADLVTDVTHIILDEIHEREQITDYLLIALKEMIKFQPNLKLILMSATMEGNRDVFKKFFEGSTIGHVCIPSRLYNVDEFYLADVIALTKFKPQGKTRRIGKMNRSDSPDMFGKEKPAVQVRMFGDRTSRANEQEMAVKHVSRVLRNCPRSFEPIVTEELRNATKLKREDIVRVFANKASRKMDIDEVDIFLAVRLIVYLMDSSIEGAILVFLPGVEDIWQLKNILDLENDTVQKPLIFILHSQLHNRDQQKVFEKVPRGYRKVILSTNIAEASLTIDDVVFVIDTGKAKQKTYDYSSSFSELKLIWIAKTNAVQRSGRAGRCRNGFCFRLYTEDDYKRMLDTQLPEMKRCAIHDIVLNAKMFSPEGVSARKFLAGAPEPPSEEAIKHSYTILKELGALRDPTPLPELPECDDEPEITELGRILARLPLDPQLGRMLMFGIFLKCFSPILTLVSALSYRDPYAITVGEESKNAARIARDEYGRRDFSDHVVLMRAINNYSFLRESEMEHCDKMFLNPSSMRMIVGIRKQLISVLANLCLVPPDVKTHDEVGINKYSDSWPMVQAAIMAGSRIGINIVGSNCKNVRISEISSASVHPSCVIKRHFTDSVQMSDVVEKYAIDKRDPNIEFLAFHELVKLPEGLSIKTVTAVSPLCAFLFFGSAQIPDDLIKSYILGEKRSVLEEQFSDVEDKVLIKEKDFYVNIEKWVKFGGAFTNAQLLTKLRFKVMSHFSNILHRRKKRGYEDLLRCLKTVLEFDHKANFFDECSI